MGEFLEKILQPLKRELGSYSKKQRAFMFFAMFCGFFICCEYSMMRPVSNSLFIHAFSAKAFPYAWLCTIPLNFFLVSLYNRLIPKWGSKRLFVGLIFIVMGLNTLFACVYKLMPTLSFVFYIWKELYVMLMFQLVWSVIHSNVQLSKAKYLYGIFFGLGGLGSTLGASFPSFFAVAYRSENLIFLTLPVYFSLLLCYWKMMRYSDGDVPTDEKETKGGFAHGVKLISRSRFLIFALLIVVFMQMSAAIVDFQFNDYLEKAFSQKDVRTEYCARVLGIVHLTTILLQFIGSYCIIQWMGLRNSHFLVPSLLVVSGSLLAIFPIFPIVSLAFIVLKSLDFSLFGVVKEMLYVPLKPDEKFRAKAVIDVFAYRSSKGLASLLILLVNLVVVETSHMLTWINIGIAFLWIASVTYGMREYEKMISTSEA